MAGRRERGRRCDVESLYAEHGGALYHYALSVLGRVEQVEDVMQELFLKVVDRRRQVARAWNVRAYLFAMLRHEIVRFMKRRKTVSSGDAAFLSASREEGVSEEDAREVERALGKLPGEQREVVVLKIYEGLTFREIGEVTGTSSDTAASRYRYAIEKLRTLLSGKVKPE